MKPEVEISSDCLFIVWALLNKKCWKCPCGCQVVHKKCYFWKVIHPIRASYRFHSIHWIVLVDFYQQMKWCWCKYTSGDAVKQRNNTPECSHTRKIQEMDLFVVAIWSPSDYYYQMSSHGCKMENSSMQVIIYKQLVRSVAILHQLTETWFLIGTCINVIVLNI